MTDSRIKVDFFRRKSAKKFLCLKTVSGKVVRHSLTYLIVHKWLVRDVPLTVNFAHKVNHPLHAAPKLTHPQERIQDFGMEGAPEPSGWPLERECPPPQ